MATDNGDRLTGDMYSNRRAGAPKTSLLTRSEQYRQATRDRRIRKLKEGSLDRRVWLQSVTDMTLTSLKKIGPYPDKGAVIDALVAGEISSDEVKVALREAKKNEGHS